MNNYSNLLTFINPQKALLLNFHAALIRAGKRSKVVVLLDSIDQLDPAFDGRTMNWLITKLPAGVRMIVSTLPDAKYEALPALKVDLLQKS